jgi:hypothetical protein
MSGRCQKVATIFAGTKISRNNCASLSIQSSNGEDIVYLRHNLSKHRRKDLHL